MPHVSYRCNGLSNETVNDLASRLPGIVADAIAQHSGKDQSWILARIELEEKIVGPRDICQSSVQVHVGTNVLGSEIARQKAAEIIADGLDLYVVYNTGDKTNTIDVFVSPLNDAHARRRG